MFTEHLTARLPGFKHPQDLTLTEFGAVIHTASGRLLGTVAEQGSSVDAAGCWCARWAAFASRGGRQVCAGHPDRRGAALALAFDAALQPTG